MFLDPILIAVFIGFLIGFIWGLIVGKGNEFIRKIRLKQFLERQIADLKNQDGINGIHDLGPVMAGRYQAYTGLLKLLEYWEKREGK
ncbi:MAG: hypothetical protein ACFFCW_22875 [Candidatus Hodarchaeota archaeon]